MSKMSDFNLQQHGITVENIVRNPAVPVLYEHAIRGEGTSKILLGTNGIGNQGQHSKGSDSVKWEGE